MNAKEKKAQETAAAQSRQEPQARVTTQRVYCGPSVPGIARQYAVYAGKIPDTLEEFIREHPAARGLLVSVDRFPQVRKRLETPGTAEYILYQKVREEL